MKKILGALVLTLGGIPLAQADAITDWNIKAGEIITAVDMPPPPASRAMAIIHTAAYEAANAIARRYPAPLDRTAVLS